jgi:hypothetical protein
VQAQQECVRIKLLFLCFLALNWQQQRRSRTPSRPQPVSVTHLGLLARLALGSVCEPLPPARLLLLLIPAVVAVVAVMAVVAMVVVRGIVSRGVAAGDTQF